MTRKLLAILLALVLACSLIPAALADDEAAAESANVLVTISNAGLLTTIRFAVTVTDQDGDGALTINDALIIAHDTGYQGGLEAGYATAETEWGLSLTKLWGVENGGSYGYYVNNQMAMSLTDPIKTGDSIYAWVYTDAEGYSDVYSYFDPDFVELTAGEDCTLTLYAITFDENFAPVVAPLAGANIVINDEEHRITTDENGVVSLHFEYAGINLVSAVAEGKILVPPVCEITVAESDEPADPEEPPVDPNVPSGPDVKNFEDVPADAWFFPAVETALNEGLMVGKAPTVFDPEAQMTVAEYLTVLYRMGEKAGLFTGKQTVGAEWQEGARFMNAGLGLNAQDLDAPITRRDMAKATAAYLRIIAATKSYVTREAKAFTDVEGDEAAEDIAYMYEVKAIDGYNDDTFRPDNTIRRCEVAQVISNMLANVQLAEPAETAETPAE